MIKDSKITLGKVVLNVTNLQLQSDFYQQVIGLSLLGQTSDSRQLGLADQKEVLVELRQAQTPAEPTAGLFHLALLLPDRPALATVFKHLLLNQVPLQGGSDHGYSEAIYLQDPEGNGIELYADKPISQWDILEDGRILGTTVALAADDLLAQASPSPQGYQLPPGTSMGHVHLSVPDAATSSQRFQKVFGLEDKFSLPTASFIASGTYHHHLAFNQWAGTDLAARQPGQAGLNHLTISFKQELDFLATKKRAPLHQMTLVSDDQKTFLLQDPDGIRIQIRLAE